MPELLHEYWENEAGGEFGPVRMGSDQLRPALTPNARKVFDLRASSWFEAMRLHNERLGYGDHIPPDGIDDQLYTDKEAAEQEAYLLVRNIR
jgi:hypothetical protein